jgi:hypothetical protein
MKKIPQKIFRNRTEKMGFWGAQVPVQMPEKPKMDLYTRL